MPQVQVTIKNVEQSEWQFLVAFAEGNGLTMADLVRVFADILRARTGKTPILDFVREQRERRRQFVRDFLAGQQHN